MGALPLSFASNRHTLASMEGIVDICSFAEAQMRAEQGSLTLLLLPHRTGRMDRTLRKVVEV